MEEEEEEEEEDTACRLWEHKNLKLEKNNVQQDSVNSNTIGNSLKLRPTH